MHKLNLCRSREPLCPQILKTDSDITINYSTDCVAEILQSLCSVTVSCLLIQTALPVMLCIPSMNSKEVIATSVKRREKIAVYTKAAS